MTSITRTSTILAFASVDNTNPYLKVVKFIFADDKPNINAQAIPYEEFESLKTSVIGMPIKMRFLGSRGGAGGHDGAIPIGHISGVAEETAEDGSHQLIADGVLYAEEYPDIVEYLEDKFEKGEAPGLSWELSYHDSIVEKGITWLKGVIARAATFVRHPAYGKRTALLALASDMTLSEEEIEQEITALFAKEQDHEGGTNNVTLEEALAEIARLTEELGNVQAELTAKASENETLAETASRVEELEATVAELRGQIDAQARAALIGARTQAMVEAGVELDTDADKLAAKQELWAAMSEDIFNEVIATLTAVASKAPKKTEASARFTLPKITPPEVKNGSTPVDLMNRMKALNNRIEDSE